MGIAEPDVLPLKSWDPVETSWRDALKLARRDRSGDLTPLWASDPKYVAVRALVRVREARPSRGSG
jgi:hypothetical protein